MTSSPSGSRLNRSTGCRSSASRARSHARTSAGRSLLRRASPTSRARANSSSRGSSAARPACAPARWSRAQLIRPRSMAAQASSSRWRGRAGRPPTSAASARFRTDSATASSPLCSATSAVSAAGVSMSSAVRPTGSTRPAARLRVDSAVAMSSDVDGPGRSVSQHPLGHQPLAAGQHGRTPSRRPRRPRPRGRPPPRPGRRSRSGPGAVDPARSGPASAYSSALRASSPRWARTAAVTPAACSRSPAAVLRNAGSAHCSAASKSPTSAAACARRAASAAGLRPGADGLVQQLPGQCGIRGQCGVPVPLEQPRGPGIAHAVGGQRTRQLQRLVAPVEQQPEQPPAGAAGDVRRGRAEQRRADQRDDGSVVEQEAARPRPLDQLGALPRRHLQQVGEQVDVEGRAARHGVEQCPVVVVERCEVGPDPVGDLDRDLEADRLSRGDPGGRDHSARRAGDVRPGTGAGDAAAQGGRRSAGGGTPPGRAARSPRAARRRSSARRRGRRARARPCAGRCPSPPRAPVSAGGRGHGR